MRFYILLFFTVIFITGCLCQPPDIEAIKKRLKAQPIDLDKIRQSAPVDDEKMTRLLKVDYWFRTESLLYDDIEKKENAKSVVIAGNFTFETMHHDTDGGMLARFALTQCNTNNCGNPAPVYVAFQQGGNNIKEVLVNLKESESESTWNFLYAIVNTIYTPVEYGEGDLQTVDTVYGRCRVNFGRPEDKRFRRIIDGCEVGYGQNYSLFDHIDEVVYNQDVWYTQNTKVDADIVMIDAVELLSFRIPFSTKYGFQLESRTHVEITNRTRLFIPRHCEQEVFAARCAEQAFGATKVGDRLFENVKLVAKKENKLNELISTYREHLNDMGAAHICEKHSQLYSLIHQEARTAKREDWEAILRDPENDHVLTTISNALGGVGTAESVLTGQQLLLVEAPDHFDDFLFGIAHSASKNEKWHKQLMYWLAELETSFGRTENYWKLANTIATVLNKRCNRTPSSLNSCNKGKEAIVNKFISSTTANGLNEKVFEVLTNIPIFGTYTLAKKTICSTENIDSQKAALRLIFATDKKLYESQLTQKLIRVFRNTCPLQSPTSHSQIAIDILLKCIPEHQNVATLILRTETLSPDDQEKWQYLYKAIRASGDKDELKAELWSRMRQFRVFRPNYLHRSLQADSHVHWQQIADASGFKMFSTLSAQFYEKSYERSNLDVIIKNGKNEDSVLSLAIDTSNLNQFVSTNVETSGNPEAKVRLGLFGHLLPSRSLFNGTASIISTIWEADGRTITAFDGHIPVRDAQIAIPLLSGLTVNVSTSGSVSLRLTASAEVSLWNQKSLTKVDASTSGSMIVTASLNQQTESLQRIESTFSAVSTQTTDTDVLFTSLPYNFCLKSSQGNVEISQKTSIQHSETPKKKLVSRSKRSIPGITYKLDGTTINQCNLLRNEL